MNTKKCIFCQRRRKMAREHLWSGWIGELFGASQAYSVKRRSPGGTLAEWDMVGLNQKASLVCKNCNNTWMSDIESQAKPMLSAVIKYGVPLSFLPFGVASLAAFTFKNAVISDHTHRQGNPFFTVSDRLNFMKSLTIPHSVQMWIASSGSDLFSGTFHSYVFEVRSAVGLLRDVDFFSFTWSAGYLVLQVLAVRFKRHIGEYEGLPILKPDSKFDPVSLRFWPTNGRPITWNPAYDLSRESFEVFKNRWKAPVNVMLMRS